ncbi:hypothetical protein [Microbacterium laevaniformans]|uniref:hypothetical protein n=1 Tax=Microbacterium laevaniformans TaxID=36807 RepID=UPI003D9800F5
MNIDQQDSYLADRRYASESERLRHDLAYRRDRALTWAVALGWIALSVLTAGHGIVWMMVSNAATFASVLAMSGSVMRHRHLRDRAEQRLSQLDYRADVLRIYATNRRSR